MNKPVTSQGYAYLALLLAIVIIGIALAGAGALWSKARQREREQELLKVGAKFREAIGQYYNNTPGAVKQYPPTLDALLRDNRFPVPKRYLRQIYLDPMTGTTNWGTIESNGGIMGVHSLSGATAFKTGNFRPQDKEFEGRTLYVDWIFAYVPSVNGQAGGR
jgi:type II secretory pathway pseudopilin PulG